MAHIQSFLYTYIRENGLYFIHHHTPPTIKLKATITNVLVDVPLDELNDLDEQIRNLQREMMELYTKKTSGKIILDAYAKQGSKLAENINALKARKNKILEVQYTNEQIKQRLNDINDVLDENKPNKEFDPYLFKKLVDEITINDRNKLTFKFKIGIVRTIIVPIK